MSKCSKSNKSWFRHLMANFLGKIQYRCLGEIYEAKQLAERHGMELLFVSRNHYSLRHLRKGWILDLHPGSERIVPDPQCGRVPIIKLPVGWTILDAVKAMVTRYERRDEKRRGCRQSRISAGYQLKIE